jgi:hypothetical protein
VVHQKQDGQGKASSQVAEAATARAGNMSFRRAGSNDLRLPLPREFSLREEGAI